MTDAVQQNRPIQLGAPVLVALALTMDAVWGQSELEASAGQAPPTEEITIRGQRTLGLLRSEAEAARERVYDLFNAINDDDAFDIRCRNESRSGTRVPSRVCRPRYVNDATSDAGRDFLSSLLFDCTSDTGFVVITDPCAQRSLSRAQVAHGEMHYMDQRLAEEIERAARERPEFRRAIVEYQALERRYDDFRAPEEAQIRASIVALPSRAAAREDAVVAPQAVELPTPDMLASRPSGLDPLREGWIELRYSILSDGRTADVRVVDVVPPGLATAGAVGAVEAWRFEPATFEGTPIDWHNNVAVIVLGREEKLHEATPAFAEAYEQVAMLAADGRYDRAKSLSERMRGELASRLYELQLAAMQLAAIEHALGDPHAALEAIRCATDPHVPQLADEELVLGLEHRFALEVQLGRVTDALESYERRVELERLPSDHSMARQAAALERALEAPDTNLVIKGRIDRDGRWEHRLSWATFAVGDVDGRIERIEVECSRRKTVLPFEAEVEVSIPAAWGECALFLGGRPDATFTLYEFREPMS